MSDIELEYEEKLAAIENNDKLSDKQKFDKKVELVNSFGLKRYCCKMRLMGYVDMVKTII